jgi:GxxExxY protein
MSNHLENPQYVHTNAEPLDQQLHRKLQRSINSSKNCANGSSVVDRAPLAGNEPIYKDLSYAIVGAVIEVHRHLGPGQLESNYERALAKELAHRGIPFRRQVGFASYYKGEVIGELVADLVVDDRIILELKAVERVHSVHKAQLLSYLRATGMRLGLLINFNEAVVWKGIKRIVC